MNKFFFVACIIHAILMNGMDSASSLSSNKNLRARGMNSTDDPQKIQARNIAILIEQISLLPKIFNDPNVNLNEAIERTGKFFSALYKKQKNKLLLLSLIANNLNSFFTTVSHHKKSVDELKKAFITIIGNCLKGQNASQAAWIVYVNAFPVDEFRAPDIIRLLNKMLF